MPVRAILTEGTRADCREAIHLIEGIGAQNLLADRGYDTSEIVAFALSAGINVVIPPKKNRKEQREYDRYLYKIRHLVENAFLWLKRWRESLRAMRKTLPLSFLLFTSDASLFGWPF